MNSVQHIVFFSLWMGALLILSAFFSGTETALFSLSPEERRRPTSHKSVAKILSTLRRDPSGLLTSILLGNLVVNILFFSTGAAAATQWSDQQGKWIELVAGVGFLLTIVLFGEIVPKAVGVNDPFGLLSVSSGALQMWHAWTAPFRTGIRWLLDRFHLAGRGPVPPARITPSELRELLDAVRHEPGFGRFEKEIIGDIVNLSAVRAREVMTPRTDLLRCPLSTDANELLEQTRQRAARHILVYRDHEDDLLGYLRTQDLFFSSRIDSSIERLLRPLVFVPETCRADCLLRDFIEKEWHLAGVVDEYGGLAGIITVEDLFSEVVGDIMDEPIPAVVSLDENTCRLSGQLSIRSWRELFTGLLPDEEVESLAFDTLGGLIVSMLGRMPAPGDTVTIRNLQLTVETLSNRRIETVLLHLDSQEISP